METETRSRTIVSALRGCGASVDNEIPDRIAHQLTAAYLLVLPRDRKPKYRSDGSQVRDWLLTLPTGSNGYSWGKDGEEGHLGLSVKSESSKPDEHIEHDHWADLILHRWAVVCRNL